MKKKLGWIFAIIAFGWLGYSIWFYIKHVKDNLIPVEANYEVGIRNDSIWVYERQSLTQKRFVSICRLSQFDSVIRVDMDSLKIKQKQ
jgi:hypothetical protein